MRDFGDLGKEYFKNVSQDESDLMQNTKSYVMRLRMNKEIDFTDDFRKKHMTREYGNYRKYEKNSISQETDKGENDDGRDRFQRNNNEMMKRINNLDNEE